MKYNKIIIHWQFNVVIWLPGKSLLINLEYPSNFGNILYATFSITVEK